MDNNDYYSYLINLFINSATNNAIIQGISQLIYGRVQMLQIATENQMNMQQ